MLRETLHPSLRYGETHGDGAMTLKRKNLPAVLTLFLGAVVIGALWPSLTTAQTPGTVFRDCPECPEMVVVPAGSFRMGDLSGGGDSDEKPVHRVTIPRPFAAGRSEVTQAEWEAVMGSNPSRFKGARNPVERGSWNDALEFARKLSAKTGKRYRLLSEAEWEYIARANTNTKWFCGSNESCVGSVAWYGSNSSGETHPIGQKSANGFGIYDLHGNVWEWTEDCYHDSYNGAPTNGSAWTSGSDCHRRVLRGGSWYYILRNLRSANRNGLTSTYRGNRFGFRVARTF